jgi:hypothetical protein
MKTTERFDRAVKKLYTAFHEGTLNALDCSKCAVGNIVGSSAWANHRVFWNKVRPGSENVTFSGYPMEVLVEVEEKFIYAYDESGFLTRSGSNLAPTSIFYDKEKVFEGLCDVVKYLAELDGIPNPMDYTKLFETTETGEPKYELV